MSEPWWRILLREQRNSRFAGIAGAHGAVTVPISDRLLSSILAARLPASIPLSQLEIHAEGNNSLGVRLKLKFPAFLPPFTLRFAIVGQPRLPESPVLTCVMLTRTLAPFMGPLARLFARLPSWIAIDQDRVQVDLRRLAAAYGADDVLALLTSLEVTTQPGAFVVSVRAQV